MIAVIPPNEGSLQILWLPMRPRDDITSLLAQSDWIITRSRLQIYE